MFLVALWIARSGGCSLLWLPADRHGTAQEAVKVAGREQTLHTARHVAVCARVKGRARTSARALLVVCSASCFATTAATLSMW